MGEGLRITPVTSRAPGGVAPGWTYDGVPVAPDARLLQAVVRSDQQRVINEVIDESLARSAELREEREKRRAEERIEASRRQRADEFERQEREAAEALAAKRDRTQAAILLQESEERQAQTRALVASADRREGPLDLVA